MFKSKEIESYYALVFLQIPRMKVYESPIKNKKVETKTENICLLSFQSIKVTVQISKFTTSILPLNL